MKLSGYETYCTYLAIKQHFTNETYDFFKYNGKVHVSKEKFLTRKDRFQFEKLARKCDDIQTHILANFLADRTWIGQMLDDDAYEMARQMVKRHQSMSYIFKNEIERYPDIRKLFKEIEGTDMPLFLNDYMCGNISFETILILNHFVGFIHKFDAKLKDDFLWSKFSFKARKYSPFLLPSLDKNKFAKILKEYMNAHI